MAVAMSGGSKNGVLLAKACSAALLSVGLAFASACSGGQGAADSEVPESSTVAASVSSASPNEADSQGSSAEAVHSQEPSVGAADSQMSSKGAAAPQEPPDAVSPELAATFNDYEAVRKEKAEKFCTAVFTSTKVANGEYFPDKSLEKVADAYLSPLSPLRKSTADQLEYDASILMRGGSPRVAKSAVVADIQGDAYYVDVQSEMPKATGEQAEKRWTDRVVVIFDDADAIMHAFKCNTENGDPYGGILHADYNAMLAFSSKVNELKAQFGDAQMQTRPHNSTLIYMEGLAYVDLVDFGDGAPRLVVCYHDPRKDSRPDEPGGYPESYVVEVWQYGERGLENAYRGTAQLNGLNTYCGAVRYHDVDGRRYITTSEGNYPTPEGEMLFKAYGLTDGGAFGLVAEVFVDYSQEGNSYEVNGTPVALEEGKQVLDNWFGYDKQKAVGLSSVLFNGQPPYPLVQHTGKTSLVLDAVGHR